MRFSQFLRCVLVSLVSTLVVAGCSSSDDASGAAPGSAASQTDPASTDGTDPDSTDDTDPDNTDPASTDSTDSTDPDSTDGTDPDSTDPASTASTDPESSDAVEELFPDVLDASATSEGDGMWSIAATISSPYDSPDRYADAWRVVGPDGTVYGERILTHDHAGEQPFTRSQGGIAIPAEVASVTIEGRDQISGYGGETFTLELAP